MKVTSSSHLYGETIIRYGFPEEYEELLEVLAAIEVPLRAAGPFTTRGRPATPKRQRRKIAGQERYVLMPIDQKHLNAKIDEALRVKDWTRQPFAAREAIGTPLDSSLKGDFSKNGVFVEVEFGNAASLFRDLFKFQIEPIPCGRCSGSDRCHATMCEVLRLRRR